MLNDAIIYDLETELSIVLGIKCSVLKSEIVNGGSINRTYRVETTLGPFFLKLNGASRYPNMFRYEQKGLELLLANSDFIVPKPLANNEVGGQQYLLMEWLEEGDAKPNSWEAFGRELANLHKTTQLKFGLNHHNFIGSLPQSNHLHSTWANFFWSERLAPQIKLAKDLGLMSSKMTVGFEFLHSKIDKLYPTELPALLHGDLWSGNAFMANNGSPAIFDPAVYFGHREIDLAMMKLFGGFPTHAFDSYQEAFPLENGWEDRLAIGQLYPLMVHVNLFGVSYCEQVVQALSKI